MNSNGTLSPPCGWCGLKYGRVPIWDRTLCHHLAGGVDWNFWNRLCSSRNWVTTLRVVWIEIIKILDTNNIQTMSPPCGWCGLKFVNFYAWGLLAVSPPCGWCGLKCFHSPYKPIFPGHHLAGGVDWNFYSYNCIIKHNVSPPCGWCGLKWITILTCFMESSHHLAGGVDWNFNPTHNSTRIGSPPCGWCGLK